MWPVGGKRPHCTQGGGSGSVVKSFMTVPALCAKSGGQAPALQGSDSFPSPVTPAELSGSAGLQPASLQPSFPQKRTTPVIPAEAGSVRHSRESGNPSSSSRPTFARSKSWQKTYPRAGDKPPRYRRSGQRPSYPRTRRASVIPAKAGIHPLFHSESASQPRRTLAQQPIHLRSSQTPPISPNSNRVDFLN